MMRTIYTVLVLIALVIGVGIYNPLDCYAEGRASISGNTLPPKESVEQESNDTPATATRLVSGRQTEAMLSSRADVDYYAYTIETDGYVTFDFISGDDATSGKAVWNIYIHDITGKELGSYTKIATNFSTQKFNFARGTQLYLKVCADKSGNESVGKLYYIRTNVVSRSDWETETMESEADRWNVRIQQADRLTGNNIYGSLWTGTDQDIYKLVVPKTGKVVLNFYLNNAVVDLGWGYDIEIYKRNGKRVSFYRQIKETTKKKFYAQKGTYYILIKANWSNSPPPATDDYAISATVKEGPVSSLKSRKISYVPKTSVLKWKGIRDADGYEIQICKNKKFKARQTKIYTTIETMYKLPRRLKGKNYYVRVRAYCDTVTGDRLYGKFTKVKKIKRVKTKEK